MIDKSDVCNVIYILNAETFAYEDEFYVGTDALEKNKRGRVVCERN